MDSSAIRPDSRPEDNQTRKLGFFGEFDRFRSLIWSNHSPSWTLPATPLFAVYGPNHRYPEPIHPDVDLRSGAASFVSGALQEPQQLNG